MFWGYYAQILKNDIRKVVKPAGQVRVAQRRRANNPLIQSFLLVWEILWEERVILVDAVHCQGKSEAGGRRKTKQVDMRISCFSEKCCSGEQQRR